MDGGGRPEQRYQALYHGNPVPMYTWQRQDDDLVLIEVNAAAGQRTGGLVGSLLGTRASELYDDQPELLADFARILADHQPVHREIDYRMRSTGEPRRFLVSFIYLPGDVVVVHTDDLTALRRSEVAYRDLVERVPAIVYTAYSGAERPFTFVSPQIIAMLGFRPEEWLADPLAWLRTVHPADVEAVTAMEDRPWAPGQRMVHEYRLLDKDGDVVWVRDEARVRAAGASEGDGPVIEGLMTDITDRKKFDEQLQHLADHDALTGLHNRRRFVEDLQAEMLLAAREGRPSCLLLLDVDHFKQVNDSLGHAAGDELLRAVTDRLLARLRRTDMLGRYGGDEFGISLPGSDLPATRQLAEQLRESVSAHPVQLRDQPVRVTVSIGVAEAGTGFSSASDALAAADLALYDAKRAGRNRVTVYQPSLSQELADSRVWSSRLREALDQDRFLLYGQPIVSLATEEVTQHELLLRLPDGEGDLLLPGEFLPHAERSGLMPRLDRWVVRQAVRLVAERERVGARPAKVEINLTGTSIGDPALVELVRREIRSSGIDPTSLVFEVTETAAISNMALAQAFARDLKDLGCSLALDDFGSGFASFYYVKHLPFDYLKIDGEFVRGMCRDATDQAVVRAIVDVARTLGRATIAEFVGDEETVAALRELGVDYAQGHHVGRPAPFGRPVARP